GSVVAGGLDVSCCSGASGTGPSEAGPSGAGPSGAGPSGAGPPGVGRGVGLGKIPPYTVGTVGAAGAPVFSIHRSGPAVRRARRAYSATSVSMARARPASTCGTVGVIVPGVEC